MIGYCHKRRIDNIPKEERHTYNDWPRSFTGEEQNQYKQNSKGNKARNLRREEHSIGSNREKNTIEGFRLVPIT